MRNSKKMCPSKERRKHFLDCNVAGSERGDPALAFTAFPKAHCPKLRSDKVQQSAKREIKRATGLCNLSARGN